MESVDQGASQIKRTPAEALREYLGTQLDWDESVSQDGETVDLHAGDEQTAAVDPSQGHGRGDYRQTEAEQLAEQMAYLLGRDL